MSKIGNQYLDGGVVPTAAQLNAVYDAVAADTINNDNVETDCANRMHFSDTPGNRINQLSTFDYDGTADWATSSTAWTTIENVAGTPSKVEPNYTAHGQIVIRVQASGLVTELTLSASKDGDGTNAQIPYNTYAFRLFATLNSGGTTVDIANCTYSFSPKAAITTENQGVVERIQYRSFAFSGLATVNAGVTIDKVELQACVGFNGNTLKVQHNHIQLIVVEN
tara:strand:- start:18612 stop:19280 length:669 start_codon:yes stop_codon:yes gene_type:complete